MAISYIIQERESTFAEGRKRRYYLIAKSNGRIGRKDLIEYMVANVSLTPSEASSALDYLLEAIPHFLKLGKVIDLGELGNLKATIRSEGSDEESEVSVHKVKEIRLNFTPSRKLKRELQQIPLERIDPTEERERKASLYRQARAQRDREVELRQKEEIARKAFDRGLSIAMIAELTGLSEEEVEMAVNSEQ